MRTSVLVAFAFVALMGWGAAAQRLESQAVLPADDAYVWLEDIHGSAPANWVTEQNAATDKVLKTDPRYQSYYELLRATFDADDRIPFAGLYHGSVYNFWQDGRNPKGVWRRTSIADYRSFAPHWEVLLDLDKLAADEKENWVLNSIFCAPSERNCLIFLSRGGGDAVVMREFDVAARRFSDNGFSLPEATLSARYVDDDTILFGTNFGPGTVTESGLQRIIKLWHRGQSVADSKLVFEGKVDDLAVWTLGYRSPTESVSILMRAVSFWDSEFFYVMPDGTTVNLPLPSSAALRGLASGQLLATLRSDWTTESRQTLKQGSLISFPLKEFLTTRKTPIFSVLYTPDARSSLAQVFTGPDIAYASIYHNVTGSIHAFRYDARTGNWTDKPLTLPAEGSTGIVTVNPFGHEVQFRYESFLAPTSVYEGLDDREPTPIKALPARFDASPYLTTQYEATSKDGTRIPYFVVHAKGAAGPVPTVLLGYGGFELPQTPFYLNSGAGGLWLAKGGAYAVANIRGGGEFGPSWHEAALKTNRQLAFDDFIAVAEDLVKRGITTPSQLGILGGSNGGLLVATVMVERPELFGAVVCDVPILDMIRYPKIGAGPAWIGEYGDPEKPDDRDALLKYSPYQNVKIGMRYSPILFITATSDDRVTPAHARKMAAKMEDQAIMCCSTKTQMGVTLPRRTTSTEQKLEP